MLESARVRCTPDFKEGLAAFTGSQMRRGGTEGELFLVGGRINAAKAHTWGLVNDVFPDADVKIYLDASEEERARRRAGDSAHSAEASEFAIKDLAARAEGLWEERAALNRAWDLWQVQHGLKRAEDTDLVYRAVAGGC